MSDCHTNCKCACSGPQRLAKEIGRVGNQRKNRDHPNHSIVEIGHNTENSPGDVRKLAVSQTPVKDYQLMTVRKTHEE